MIKISRCCFLLLLFFSTASNAQMLSGRVKNEAGTAASAVTVEFLNKNNKISTNEDGSFKIFAPNLPDTLIFSSPGYEPYKVIITEKNIKDPEFEVVLLSKRAPKDVGSRAFFSDRAGSADLAEVVVTAAGTKRNKKSIPGKSAEGYSTSGMLSGMGAAKTGYPLDTRKLISKDSVHRANTLTAGEVNDFNKWKMWEDLTEKEFGEFSSAWGIAPKQRYSVQLTDQDHKPITGEPVYLINKTTGDTAWSAISDNTGKAELWAAMRSGISTNEYRISSIKGGSDLKPSAFENGINHITIIKPCTQNDVVDIAFVVDATGSMMDEIEFLKLELEEVLQRTADRYEALQLRYGSVFYRDNGDEYLTRQVDFQDDMLKVLNFIKLQKAGGGGDFPEAVDDALDVALNKLNWSKNARAKILFLILDAPPHGNAKDKVYSLIVKAAAMGVRIIPIACSGTDKSTEFLMRSMALATNGTYAFLTNHSGVGNSHIEPSTDTYSVELLSVLMQRLLEQYLYTASCDKPEISKMPVPVTDPVISLKIYPNPTSGRFTIETKVDVQEIYISDFTGKILVRLSDAAKRRKWEVNISQYPSGMYLVKYITVDKKVGTEKIVLIH